VKSLQLADSIDSQLVSSEVACRQLASSEVSRIVLPVSFQRCFLVSGDPLTGFKVQVCGFNVAVHGCDDERQLCLTRVSLPFIPVEWRISIRKIVLLARRGLCSGGKAVDACAYTTHAVERVLFTKFFFKESVFI